MRIYLIVAKNPLFYGSPKFVSIHFVGVGSLMAHVTVYHNPLHDR